MSEISASPEALRRFFYKCNTDNEFRARFLDHPIDALKDNGIMINEQAADEIISYLGGLKERFQKEMYLPPVGWEDHRWELMKDGWGLVIKGSDRWVSI